MPGSPPVLTPVVWSEDDLTAFEQAAAEAMVAACDAIAVTAADLSQHAVDERLARVLADQEQAEAIAECVAQAAAAFKMGSEATALRTAWMASRAAQALAARVLPGDEAAAETAARHTAGLVALAVEERAAESTRAADRASSAATAAAAEVVEAADTMALAARLSAYSQGSALGGIAFDTSVQIAMNAAHAPTPPA